MEHICNHLIYKRLLFIIYKDLSQFNDKKGNYSIKKWARSLNRDCSKEDVHLAKKHMKSCSKSLAIKEMQIKAHNYISSNSLE